jgi:hypothetical protein
VLDLLDLLDLLERSRSPGRDVSARIHLTQTRLMICATQELQDRLIGRIVAHVSP